PGGIPDCPDAASSTPPTKSGREEWDSSSAIRRTSSGTNPRTDRSTDPSSSGQGSASRAARAQKQGQKKTRSGQGQRKPTVTTRRRSSKWISSYHLRRLKLKNVRANHGIRIARL